MMADGTRRAVCSLTAASAVVWNRRRATDRRHSALARHDMRHHGGCFRVDRDVAVFRRDPPLEERNGEGRREDPLPRVRR